MARNNEPQRGSAYRRQVDSRPRPHSHSSVGRSVVSAPNPHARPAAAAPLRGDAHAYDRTGAQYSAKRRAGGPWRVVFVLALAVFLVALLVLGRIAYSYWDGQRSYDKISQEAFDAPADLAAPGLADFRVDWDALRAVNPDVVGWVYVPDTVVNYPIVHRAGDDSHYLNHDFTGKPAGAVGAEFGCIMLSGVNDGTFDEQVNVIYGHNMANGSMFAQFADFVDSEVFNAHRDVYVLTPKGNYRLETFAVNRVAGTDTSVVVPHPGDKAQLESYVQKRLDASIVAASPALADSSAVEQVFVFSTCDNADDNYRFITSTAVKEYLPVN